MTGWLKTQMYASEHENTSNTRRLLKYCQLAFAPPNITPGVVQYEGAKEETRTIEAATCDICSSSQSLKLTYYMDTSRTCHLMVPLRHVSNLKRGPAPRNGTNKRGSPLK